VEDRDSCNAPLISANSSSISRRTPKPQAKLVNQVNHKSFKITKTDFQPLRVKRWLRNGDMLGKKGGAGCRGPLERYVL
jgi:hypothetical protein